MYKGYSSHTQPMLAPSGVAGSTKVIRVSENDNGNGPDPVDVHVGMRLRMLRKLKNFSQEKLAQALGLTFQQVQKYERADNRIGASRLHQIAQALGVSTSYFFDGYGKPARAPVYAMAEDGEDIPLDDIMQRSETIKLVSLYYQIQDDATRKQVVDMVKTLAKKK